MGLTAVPGDVDWLGFPGALRLCWRIRENGNGGGMYNALIRVITVTT
ncbi:hypothetical protein KCP71_06650 [Salmonella enterica subsp. enterica]|nr:hypothetical protein KCP71_06650 [Salmonella enterica subsp. enterica]